MDRLILVTGAGGRHGGVGVALKNKRGFGRPTDVVLKTTGAPPMSLDDFIRANAAEFSAIAA